MRLAAYYLVLGIAVWLLIAAFLDKTEDAPRAAAEQLLGIVSRNQRLLTPRLMEEPEYSGTLGLLFHLAVPFVVETDAGFTAVVGEAWLALPAKYRLFPALAPLVRCLGQRAHILAVAPPRHVLHLSSETRSPPPRCQEMPMRRRTFEWKPSAR